jgi:hypothetical protein
MHLSNSALRAELGTLLRQLQDTLRRLGDHIQHDAHDAWLWQPPKSARPAVSPPDLPRRETLSRMAAAIQAIKYEDNQDPHESRIYPGIVALSPQGVALADDVNRHKSALARVLRAMDGRTEMGTTEQRTGEKGERPLREVALEAFYFRRLHHWQATRRLEILRESEDTIGTLEYVGFIWATLREVRRTSKEALLQQAGQPDARLLSPEDLDTLKSLPANEPLAIVRPGHTTPKANLRWQPRDGAPATSKVRIAVLPLILPGDQLPPRLRRLPPSPAARHPRLSRADIEIESTPICHSLPVYRYLKPVRVTKRKLANKPHPKTRPQ